MLKIAVCIPTFFRPYGLRRILQSIKDTVVFDDVPGLIVDAVVTHEPDDIEAVGIAKKFGAILATNPIPRKGSGSAWNIAMASALDYDAYVLGSDDMYFMYGIWPAVLTQIQAGYGMVGFDGNIVRELRVDSKTHKIIRNNRYDCHYLLTREFIIKYNGGVMAIPHYIAYNLDVETHDRAVRAGQFIHAADANVKHDWKGTANRGGSFAKQDNDMYEARKRRGWPDDFEAILK
jgi:hypothetical protein